MIRNLNRNKLLLSGVAGCLIGLIVLCLLVFKPTEKEIDLLGLIETPYDVLALKENISRQDYEISVSGTFNDDDNVALAVAFFNKIADVKEGNLDTVTIHVFLEGATINRDMEAIVQEPFTYTIVMDAKTIKKYNAIHLPNVEENVLASQNWVVEDAYFDITYDLNFNAVIMEALNQEELLAQLKGLANEMVRINVPAGESSVVKVASKNGAQDVFYVSTFEDYLIECEELESHVSELVVDKGSNIGELSKLFKPLIALANTDDEEEPVEEIIEHMVGVQGNFVSLNDILDAFEGELDVIEGDVLEYVFTILDQEIILTEGVGYTKVNGQLEPLFLEVSPKDENVKQIVWAIPTIVKDEVLVPIHYVERLFNLQYIDEQFLLGNETVMGTKPYDFEIEMDTDVKPPVAQEEEDDKVEWQKPEENKPVVTPPPTPTPTPTPPPTPTPEDDKEDEQVGDKEENEENNEGEQPDVEEEENKEDDGENTTPNPEVEDEETEAPQELTPGTEQDSTLDTEQTE